LRDNINATQRNATQRNATQRNATQRKQKSFHLQPKLAGPFIDHWIQGEGAPTQRGGNGIDSAKP